MMESRQYMTDMDTIIQEQHNDLKGLVEKACKKKGIMYNDINVGFAVVLEGNYEENTIVELIKPNDKFFKMKVDLEGNETHSQLKELADFFIYYLEATIARDMQKDYMKLILDANSTN